MTRTSQPCSRNAAANFGGTAKLGSAIAMVEGTLGGAAINGCSVADDLISRNDETSHLAHWARMRSRVSGGEPFGGEPRALSTRVGSFT